jgi:hypothetical protein
VLLHLEHERGVEIAFRIADVAEEVLAPRELIDAPVASKEIVHPNARRPAQPVDQVVFPGRVNSSRS